MTLLFRCKRCLDVGWVLVRAESNEASPCPTCNHVQWERWRSGEWEPSFHRAPRADAPDTATAASALERIRSTLREAS